MNRRVALALTAAAVLTASLIGYGVYQSWAADGFEDCSIEISAPKTKVKLSEPLQITARITNRSWHPRLLTLHEAIQYSLQVYLSENQRPVGYNPTVAFKSAPDSQNRQLVWPHEQLEATLQVKFEADKQGVCRAEFYGMHSGPVTQLDKLKVCVVGLPFSARRAKAEKLLSNYIPIEVIR